jgi:hypothetical protein
MTAYILSFSSVAYLSVFLCIILLAINFGVIRYLFIAIPLSIFLFYLAYNNAPEFKSRVDGLNALFVQNILEKGVPKGETRTGRAQRIKSILKQIHGSSFVLYNNYYIAFQNFGNNPIFGSGLGSHEIAYEKYNLNSIIGDIYEFNAKDANSMLLRIISELGLLGLILIFVFISKCYVSKNLLADENEDFWVISNALLVLILCQLLRQGNYTFAGFFLYGWMFYYNKVAYEDYRANFFISKPKR